MKIFSVQSGPLGQRLVTGSTAASSPIAAGSPVGTGSLLGANAPLSTPGGGGTAFSSGLAVSVLPMEYQKRLLGGGRISVEELSSGSFGIVE